MVGAEAKQLDLVLAHISLDRQHRRLALRRQRLQRARGAMHLVADAADIEDDKILAVGIDQALQLANHAPATFSRSSTPPRWCAWVMAMASASVASADFGSALGKRIFIMTVIWFLSSW